MRYIGLALVVITGVCAGMAAGERLSARAAFFGKLEEMLSYIAEEAAYSGEPYDVLFRRAPCWEELFCFPSEALYSNMPLQLSKAIYEGAFAANLREDQQTELCALWSALGTGARSQEVNRLALGAKRAGAWRAEAEKVAWSRGGLYRTIGLYGGLAAAILLA